MWRFPFLFTQALKLLTPLIILSRTHNISEDDSLSSLYHDLLAISLTAA